MLTAEQAEILRFAKNGQMVSDNLPPCNSRWHSRCTVPAPGPEENYRCDVSFERPLITSRPRTRYTHPEKENSDGKSLKIKRFASCCDEIWDSSSIEGNDKLSTDPLTAILASLDHFYGIYWASSWNGRLQSPHAAFPFFLLLVDS